MRKTSLGSEVFCIFGILESQASTKGCRMWNGKTDTQLAGKTTT